MATCGWRDWLRLTLLLLVLFLAGCTARNSPIPIERGAAAHSHMVQRGDTLYSIAWRNGLDYRTVAGWNGIRAPYTIYVGQRIRLRPSHSDSRDAESGKTPHVTAGKSRQSRVVTAPAPLVSDANDAVMPAWRWPANGPVLRRFDADGSGKKGVSIGGTHGSKVHAAAAGTVVYAGSGLVGYGRLIIVKHNDVYLSAYGHNRHLLVNEGDAVRSGQVIAEMGSSGTNRIQLHFEIRRKGKPVDPLRYLPRR